MNTTINQRIIGQILLWGIIFFFLPFLVSGGQMGTLFLYRALGLFTGLVILIPLNLKVLFPLFYIKRKFEHFITFSVLSILVISIIIVCLRSFINIPDFLPLEIGYIRNIPKPVFYVMGNFFPLIMVFLSSTLYEILIVANESAREATQLKSEKLEAELKFLKSQINPHFLFNSLNNIYTLTLINPKSAGDSLLKLSEMLRYLLYECDANKVELGRELTYLQNYIDLFSLKDEADLNIKFDENDIDKNVMIAPLLLIPFVENAFKHSQIEDLEHGWINITLFGDTTQVYFEIKNSLPKTNFSKDEIGGIGLQNVKRQLELIYPKKHTLKIDRTETEFSVELTITV
jgi:two-component system, LytTR family, sensor kinase